MAQSEITLKLKVDTEAMELFLQALKIVHELSECDPMVNHGPAEKIIKDARALMDKHKGKSVGLFLGN